METPGVDAGEAALVAVATSPDATDSNDDRIAVAEQEPGHTFENSVGMSFVLVPGGEFWMGSPNTEQDSGAIERPQHRVTISRDFYVGAWEVTQGQYTTVAGENPSHFRDGPPETALLRPVENVSWNEAVAFCDALSRRPAEREVGRVYRLLSEAEWEYACRAGSREGFAFGSKLTASDAHFGMSTSSAPASVGSYSQNEFGLFDMHGNVWEWCSDRFAEYQAAAQIDPAGSQSANLRVIRGGCTSSKADECRSASRAAFAPEDGVKYIGFRVVCEVRQP
jgi:formylglycine-generating enzyme required for sulfatase activity